MHERTDFQYVTKSVHVVYQCNTYVVHVLAVRCVGYLSSVYVPLVVIRQAQYIDVSFYMSKRVCH